LATPTIYDPISPDVTVARRKQVQEDFGRHIAECRNRMAALVREWIETDASFPIPIYDRLINRIKGLDPGTRADIASIALLMADEMITAVLMAFGRDDDMRSGDSVVNYAIVAQVRGPSSDEVDEQVDVNRGKPVIAIWDEYKRWLSRHTPAALRTTAARRESGSSL
jgi:hypothetical protein